MLQSFASCLLIKLLSIALEEVQSIGVETLRLIRVVQHTDDWLNHLFRSSGWLPILLFTISEYFGPNHVLAQLTLISDVGVEDGSDKLEFRSLEGIVFREFDV